MYKILKVQGITRCDCLVCVRLTRCVESNTKCSGSHFGDDLFQKVLDDFFAFHQIDLPDSLVG